MASEKNTTQIPDCSHNSFSDAIEPREVSRGSRLHAFRHAFCASDGYKKVIMTRCGDRTCPVCLERDYYSRLNSYEQTLAKLTPTGYRFRFLTLTTKNIITTDAAVLRGGIRHIKKSFERMRRWKRYRRLIFGGLRGIELKFDRRKGWNIHIHIMFVGEYLDICCQGMKDANSKADIEYYENVICRRCKQTICLRRDWQKASGGSPVVHIKDMWHLRGGIKYIVKYVTKEPDLDGQADLYNEAVKSFRLIQGFGVWFGVVVLKSPTICPVCGGLKWIIDLKVSIAYKYATPISRGPPEFRF